jgi:L,D-transpeptidase ErfK/SrfK
MPIIQKSCALLLASLLLLPLSSYSSHHGSLPRQIAPPGEKLIIVDPNVHAFGAYTSDGVLVRSGMATAGSNWCRDLRRPCRTRSGTFHIYSLGGPECKSHKFPLPHGGAPMPYCMFFNGSQALHGSYEVVYGNISHGCVRLHVGDARWLRYNFVEGPASSNHYRGTRVIIRAY